MSRVLTQTSDESEAWALEEEALDASALDEKALQARLVVAVEKQRALEKDYYGAERTALPDAHVVEGSRYRVAANGAKVEDALAETSKRIDDLELDLRIRTTRRDAERKKSIVNARWVLALLPISIAWFAGIDSRRVSILVGAGFGLVLTVCIFFFTLYLERKTTRRS